MVTNNCQYSLACTVGWVFMRCKQALQVLNGSPADKHWHNLSHICIPLLGNIMGECHMALWLCCSKVGACARALGGGGGGAGWIVVRNTGSI
jgi:hypothetical protein